MNRLIRACAFVTLFVAAAASFAASPAPTDETLAPLTSAYVHVVKPGPDAELHRELFLPVLQRVHRTYAREVDMGSLMAAALKSFETVEPQSGDAAAVFKKAVNAALATLDPHSRYLDPRAQSNQQDAMAGNFGGLGLEVEAADGLVRIVSPMAGTPAARAGLQRGDLIVRFDDQPVLGMPLSDAISRMRGRPGTPIALTIRRAGVADDFSVSVVRDTIRNRALRWSMEGDVLVLRLATFTHSVAADLWKAIGDASTKGTPRAIVLDMRGNGGGLLNQAILTADTFLSKGEIVSLRGRTPGNRKSWQADAAESLAGMPMVVLVDGRSASAAELVAAALQENGRATVMGQRSFGKGSVQSVVSLGAGRGALKLTTALYHGPSGRTVQRTGVGPDIELVANAEAAARAAKREADRPQALPGADEPLPPRARVDQSRCAKPRPELDESVACAIAYLRAGGVDSFLVALEPQEAALVH